MPATPARPPQPSRPVEARVAQPGDRICGNCGEPNDPARKFCRRCGSSLAEAVIQAKVPWWRRIFRRKPKTYAAGERTKSMGPGAARSVASSTGKLRSILFKVTPVLAIAGISIGIIAIPSWRAFAQDAPNRLGGLVDEVRRFFVPTLVIVHPIPGSTTASSEVAEHPARLVVDTFSNTDWQSTEAAPSITVVFEDPVDLGAVIVHSGNATAFVDFRRPSKLEFVLADGSTIELDLVDEHDPQQFEISADDVESLTIRVVDTFGMPDVPVSLSEIEFFTKQ